jgi:HD superfamily phosphohydrolase
MVKTEKFTDRTRLVRATATLHPLGQLAFSHQLLAISKTSDLFSSG